MGFWAQRSTEPKRQYRFLFSFNGVDQWIVKTTKKPSFETKSTVHSYLNYDFKYPGKTTWGDITVKLVDPVRPDATATLMKILEVSGYRYPNEAGQSGMNPMTMSKKRAVDVMGSVFLKQLDADGIGYLEVWRLENAWISKCDFGQLSYGDEGLVEIDLTLTFDWATLNPTDVTTGLAPGAGLPNPNFQPVIE